MPEQTQTPGTSSGGRYDEATGRTWYDNGGQEVWADLETLQGACVLPDGTMVAGGTDEFAPRLCEIIVARDNGGMTRSEAEEAISEIARQVVEEEAEKYANEKARGFSEDERALVWENAYEEYFGENYNIRLNKFLSRTADYYNVTDITDRLDEIIRDAEADVREHLRQLWEEANRINLSCYGGDGSADAYHALMLDYFREIVTNKGRYDIKEWDEFQAHPIFVYNGELISRDTLGNLLYGYLTRVCGINWLERKAGAGLNQVFSGRSSWRWILNFGDDPRDTERIEQGMEIYDQTHP